MANRCPAMAEATQTVSDHTPPLARAKAWARRAVPTALVFLGLAGVAYWGHATEWKFLPDPRRPEAGPGEERLFWVEPGPKPGGRCAEHGLLVCPVCDPRTAELPTAPAVTAEGRERVRRALEARTRVTPGPADAALLRVIRFASAEAVDKAGVDITPAWTGEVTEALAGSGELQFDPTRYARLAARAVGSAWRVFRQIGEEVPAGEVLALVESAEVGKAKAELQVALVQHRLKAQAAKDLASAPVSGRQKKEAEAARREAEIRVLAAEQALVNLGLSPRTEELRDIPAGEVADRLQRLGVPETLSTSQAGGLPGTLLPVVASLPGVVLRVGVVAGEPVDPTKVLFVVADPRQLRLTVHLRPEEARWAKVGQEARFRMDSGAAEATGRVTWVRVVADETTRTVPVWAEVPNPAGGLRASTLGTGRVVIRRDPAAVLVPAEAVHTVAGAAVVFVRDRRFLDPDGPKAFHVRPVVPGARDGGNVEVIAGLVPGEVVSTKGSAVLATELRKDLAAGR